MPISKVYCLHLLGRRYLFLICSRLLIPYLSQHLHLTSRLRVLYVFSAFFFFLRMRKGGHCSSSSDQQSQAEHSQSPLQLGARPCPLCPSLLSLLLGQKWLELLDLRLCITKKPKSSTSAVLAVFRSRTIGPGREYPRRAEQHNAVWSLFIRRGETILQLLLVMQYLKAFALLLQENLRRCLCVYCCL